MPPCETCTKILGPTRPISDDLPISDSSGAARACCPVCLGAWSTAFTEGLLASIKIAMEPYAKASAGNRFSRDMAPPTFILPGDLVYRYQCFSNDDSACAGDHDDGESPRRLAAPGASVANFGQQLKQHAKTELHKCLDKLENRQALKDYPSCMVDEELGFLGVHVVALPKKDAVYRPSHDIPVRKHQRKGRKRNIHDDSQGGDPRVNLERRLERQGHQLWPINQAMEAAVNSKNGGGDKAKQLYISPSSVLDKDECLLDFYVAVWRRPFYLRSMYTKTRRDVSQTPFHVVDNGKRRKLGATSVEEQISPVIIQHCGGISELNNNNAVDISDGCNNTVFGMAKFHASGREDMDVRMLLPEEEDRHKAAAAGVRITGRPFVYEIYDAFWLPSIDALRVIAEEVNHFDKDHNTPEPRSYGRNRFGVGIAPELQFVPASSFKQLQAETEEKVKHYGCYCWSEKPLPPSDDALSAQLGSFPLEIRQRTPIRVLHRRANSVRVRHVLSCRAHRVDDHYFRLNLSTTAGTYVKEFCHGDLGRTVPSVSTLLGCSTDILELDCEGIQF